MLEIILVIWVILGAASIVFILAALAVLLWKIVLDKH